jgi:hypothetical protein
LKFVPAFEVEWPILAVFARVGLFACELPFCNQNSRAESPTEIPSLQALANAIIGSQANYLPLPLKHDSDALVY